jgi:glucose-1-phosphate adenylyltransferase
VLALVLAGGAGGRLELLTEHRAKPAVPFGGLYRLIDFPLSNCVSSGISDVWVLQQHEPHRLTEHLANGRPWDLDRTRGGLRIVHPHTGGEGEGWHEGNADALYRERALIRDFDPDALLVLSADHVYRLDLAAVVDGHLAAGAEVTLVTTRVPRADATRFGVVEADGDGRVTGFAYKPDDPPSDVVTTEVFVYRPEGLLETLEALADEVGEESGLDDFGDRLLPRLVEAGSAREHRYDGYWRDVGTVESYWQGHMDLVERRGLDLDDPAWPILTAAPQRRPARVEASAALDGVLVSPGATVAGDVARSVLGPGVVVEAGAVVRDAVLLDDVVVRRGATVEAAIVDEAAEIGAGARVGAPLDGAPPGEALVLVGARARVSDRTQVERGGRVPLGEGGS